MLLIPCPYCGPRAETEFRCGGEAHIARPVHPAEVDDEGWRDFLYTRASTKGLYAERWNHVHGCQRWFNVLRDTISDRIVASYLMGQPRPDAGNGEVA